MRNLRAQKLPDPSQTGSAGSFFKNPVVTKLKARELITLHPNLVSYPLAGGRAKLAAGWLIEAAGLKGLSSGDAAVWPAHALILINRGRATGEDVLKLGREIAERVERRCLGCAGTGTDLSGQRFPLNDEAAIPRNSSLRLLGFPLSFSFLNMLV